MINDASQAIPNAVKTRNLRRKMDKRLLSSFIHLIKISEDGLKKSYKETLKYIEDIERNLEKNKLNCFAYSSYNFLLDAIMKNNVFAVNSILNGLSSIDFENKIDETIIDSFPEDQYRDFGCLHLIQTLKKEHLKTYQIDFDVKKPNENIYLNSKCVLEKTLDRIMEIDHESYSETKSLISHVLLMDSSSFDAGTSFKTYGCIYLSALKSSQNWTAYLEHLIHETAHHYLFLIWTENKILEKDSEKHISPLRREPRPISAIFHQMFVLARVIRIVNLFRKKGIYLSDIENMKTQYRNESAPGSFENKFNFAAMTIERSAYLTDFGMELFNSCKKIVTP